ncbi:MAG: transporter substrate-binding domain-containing protein [Bacteroidales bacterium]
MKNTIKLRILLSVISALLLFNNNMFAQKSFAAYISPDNIIDKIFTRNHKSILSKSIPLNDVENSFQKNSYSKVSYNKISRGSSKHYNDEIDEAIPDSLVLHIATSSSEYPFSYIDENKNCVGLSVDIVKTVLDRLGYSCKFECSGFYNNIDKLKNTKVDMTMSVIPRKDLGDFIYSKPYYFKNWELVTKPLDQIDSFKGMRGKNIAIRKDSYAKIRLKEIENILDINIVYLNNYIEGLTGVSSGVYYGYVMPKACITEVLSNGEYEDLVHNFSVVVAPLTIALNNSDEKLRDQIDSVFVQLEQEGEIINIYHRWQPYNQAQVKLKRTKIMMDILGLLVILAIFIILIARQRYYKKDRDHLKKEAQLADKANKMKSSFIANMSHEIRTPLNSIVGFTDLIQSTEVSKEEKERISRIIKDSTENLLFIINEVLEMSKMSAGFIDSEVNTFDFSQAIGDLIHTTQKLNNNPNIKIISKVPNKELIITSVNKNKLIQVINNFITNSLKYTLKGTITIGYNYEGKILRFYVSDTGIGIKDKDKEKVFRNFYKVDDHYTGAGLGLSICQAIIYNMKGKIGVDSIFGEGSTFWAEIPVTPSDKESIV